jgi:hypothetical protein
MQYVMKRTIVAALVELPLHHAGLQEVCRVASLGAQHADVLRAGHVAVVDEM